MTLPNVSNTWAAASQSSLHYSPSHREAQGSTAGRQLAQSLRHLHKALLRQDRVTELILPQCKHAPHGIFAGTFISLILNIPSEWLSTISLETLLYLLINLTDKRFFPISILTSFSLNYIPIP